MPTNACTGRPYRGINVVLLAMEAQAHGYPFNRWLTYRQATDLGAQTRRRSLKSVVEIGLLVFDVGVWFYLVLTVLGVAIHT